MEGTIFIKEECLPWVNWFADENMFGCKSGKTKNDYKNVYLSEDMG